MAGVFRLAFRRIAAPARRRKERADWRWSLIGADPAPNLFCGAFPTSDGKTAPYRLWRADAPRALVILLHGAFDYSGAFDEIGPKLARCGLTALAFDQRGFGGTRSRRHWCGIKRMALDVGDAVQFLRGRFGPLPVFVIGESMGADIAVQAVARGLDGIDGLVLAAPGAVAGLLRRALWGLIVRVWSYLAPKGEVDVIRLSGREFTPAAAIRLLGDPMVLRSVRPAMASGLLELAISTVGAARKVATPALTMVGSKEDFLYTTCVAALHRNLAGDKTWRIFEGGPHLLLHWRESDEVLRVVTGWIDSRLASNI
ncbi:MAG TPA: alpha/beta fold hydrolase [Rhizomicrobium sp.]|nr:alpha/beta fold hydrolase [Rhizomicrobium sp.]